MQDGHIKNNVNFFGYKNHIKIDGKIKIIKKFKVTGCECTRFASN